MRVTVRYYSQLKAAAGTSHRTLDLPDDATVAHIIRQVATEESADLRRMLLNEQDAVRPTLLLFVGEEPVSEPETSRLQDGDTLDIMPPISGG